MSDTLGATLQRASDAVLPHPSPVDPYAPPAVRNAEFAARAPQLLRDTIKMACEEAAVAAEQAGEEIMNIAVARQAEAKETAANFRALGESYGAVIERTATFVRDTEALFTTERAKFAAFRHETTQAGP